MRFRTIGMTRNENEDPDRDPAEMVDASEDLKGGDIPPEGVPGVEDLTEWDTPVGAAGESAPRVMPEDDVPLNPDRQPHTLRRQQVSRTGGRARLDTLNIGRGGRDWKPAD